MKISRRVMAALLACGVATAAVGITTEEYKVLRTWTLGSSGSPSATYGQVDCGIWGKTYTDCKHPGVDYSTGGKAINVYAVGDGVVTGVGGDTGKVCYYHKTTDKTFCALHLSKINVVVGNTVTKSTVIGQTGKVGANSVHLHFEARTGKRTAAAPNFAGSVDPYAAAKAVR